MIVKKRGLVSDAQEFNGVDLQITSARNANEIIALANKLRPKFDHKIYEYYEKDKDGNCFYFLCDKKYDKVSNSNGLNIIFWVNVEYNKIVRIIWESEAWDHPANIKYDYEFKVKIQYKKNKTNRLFHIQKEDNELMIYISDEDGLCLESGDSLEIDEALDNLFVCSIMEGVYEYGGNMSKKELEKELKKIGLKKDKEFSKTIKEIL